MAITDSHIKWPFYSELRKCGEITASTDGRHFGLNCTYCPTIFPWIKIKDFIRHLHFEHKSALCIVEQQQDQEQCVQTTVKKRKKSKTPLAAASNQLEDAIKRSSASQKASKQHTRPSTDDEKLCAEQDDPLEINFSDVDKSPERNDSLYSEDNKEEIVSEIVIDPVTFKQIKDELSDWNFSSDGEDTRTNSKSHADDEYNSPKLKLDLLARANHEVLSYIIKVYQQNAMLWDKEDTCYLIFPKKLKLFNEMAKKIHCRFKLRLVHSDISAIFEGLRKLYVAELFKGETSNEKNSETDAPKLWCFEKLDFLREQELTEDSPVDITAEQLAQMAEIYEHYTLLWNPDSDESHSRVRQAETQREMLQDVNAKLQLNMTLSQLRTRIKRLRSIYVADKRRRLKCAENNKKFSPEQPVLYEKLHFLERYIGPFRCDKCTFEVTKYPHFKAHLAAHEGRLQYTCPFCQKDFKYFNNFVVHKRRHIGEKPFVCDVCDIGFSAATDLRVHSSKHTGEKEHMCHICGASFRTTALLRTHRVRHDPNRPRFPCTLCPNVLFNKSSLNQHMDTHRQERKEVCPVCDKAFLQANTLRQHMQLHDSVKKYKCEFCAEKFSQRAGLWSHMRRNHGKLMSEA